MINFNEKKKKLKKKQQQILDGLNIYIYTVATIATVYVVNAVNAHMRSKCYYKTTNQ